MEPSLNVGLRCEACRSQPDPQYAEKPFDWFIGKFCKLSFPTTDPRFPSELMWVEVQEVKQCEGKMMLVGCLDNDPVVVTEYSHGDAVAFDRDEIHAVLG